MQALIIALRSVISVMEFVILLRVLCEFIVVKRDSAPMRFIVQVSEPLLLPVRKLLAKNNKDTKQKFDLSPLVAMIILYILSRLFDF